MPKFRDGQCHPDHKGEYGLCPICGVLIDVVSNTTAESGDRLIGSCADAFTEKQWLS